MKTTKQSAAETDNAQKQAVDSFTNGNRRLGPRRNQLYVRVNVSIGLGLLLGEMNVRAELSGECRRHRSLGDAGMDPFCEPKVVRSLCQVSRQTGD